MQIAQLEVMLHHFYRSSPFPHDTPAYRDAHIELLKEQLIETCDNPKADGVKHSNLVLTERGRIFVNALISVPLPVKAWCIPIPDERQA